MKIARSPGMIGPGHIDQRRLTRERRVPPVPVGDNGDTNNKESVCRR